MNTSTQKRIARFSGLLLLALLAVALAVPAAHAMRDFSAGTGGSSTSAGSGTTNAQQLPTPVQIEQIISRKDGSGPASSVASVPLAPATGTEAGRMRLPASGTLAITQPTSSGTSSRTVWIAVGAAVAVLVIALGAWALLRRRRQSSVPEASAYCALHPGDSQCGAG
jgi:hypothetical protein